MEEENVSIEQEKPEEALPVAGGGSGPEGAEPQEGSAPKTEEKSLMLGKFKSVDALMHAYRELEAEFTRRSRRLKALEEREKEGGTGEELPPSPSLREADRGESLPADPGRDGDELYRAVMNDQRVRARVLSEYLGSLGGVPLLSSAGSGVTAPKCRPHSFAEAGDLALGYFKSEKR